MAARARNKGNTAVRERPDSPEWDWTNQKVTCTRTFEGLYADLFAQRPDIDDQMVGYEGLPVVNVKIKRAVSGKATMTVVLEVEVTDAEPQYEIDWAGVEKPIEQHPLFKSLFPDPSGTGNFTAAQVTAYNNYQAWENAADAATKASAYNQLSATFKKLAQKKMRGVTSYLVPAPVARITTLTLSVSAASPCGSVSNSVPDFPDLPTGYKWLSTADRSTRTGRWGKWQQVQEWTGADNWDSDIYSSSSSAGSSGD